MKMYDLHSETLRKEDETTSEKVSNRTRWA